MAKAQTKAFAERISKFITEKVPFEHMQLAVNNEILKRLEDGMHGRGIRRLKAVMQGDLSNAVKRMDLTPITEERLALFNLALDEDGFCCQYGHGVRPWPTPSSQQDTPMPDATTITDTDERPQPEKRKLFDDDTAMRDEEEEEEEEEGAESTPEDASEDDSRARKDKPPTKKRRTTQPEPAPCGCLVRKAVLSKHLSTSKADDASSESALIAFRAIVRQIRNASRPVGTDVLCAEHTKQLCKVLGLYANGAHAQLTHRLDVLYSRSGNWDAAKKEYTEWFKQLPGSDTVSCFRFEPKSLLPAVEEFGKLQYLTVEDLFLRCFGTSQDSHARAAAKVWEKDGSVVLPLFSWLSENWDGQHPNGLMDMIRTEISMYDWHYRPRSRGPRVGWAKNCWFSLIQQLIRQDPVYYMFYVFLRPDHCWRLISFPYYVKSTYPGEKTAFRHIDVNVPDLLNSGRCADVIQGSVALTNETRENCTTILLGMQRFLGEWWQDLKERGYAKDGLIHKVSPDMWTDADEAKFGLEWKHQICKTGDVRISKPQLPHGSTGPATANRISVLPWFVGIQSNHDTLECVESGTWTELSNCHRDFTSPEKTPSGWSSAKYGGRLQHAFAATIRLSDLGPVSDALVGRERWDSPGTVAELDLLFGNDANLAFRRIDAWRKNARQRYEESFHSLVRTEKAMFGHHSFFFRKEQGLSVLPSFCDLHGTVNRSETERIDEDVGELGATE